MAKKWFVGCFYHGYLSQLTSTFEKREEFKDIEIWYPKMSKVVVKEGKKEVIIAPIFDNYILFNFEEDSLIWKTIMRLTPVMSFLKDESNNKPIPISDEEVEHLMSIECTEKVVNYSGLINRRVIIVDGPFANFIGTCKTIIKNKYKARVYIEMFGVVERSVEINLEHLRPV